MTTINQLKTWLKVKTENEHLEFKEAKKEISVTGGKKKEKKSLLGYVVALSNEGGGKLILGVEDKIPKGSEERKIIGTNALQNSLDAKKAIFDELNLKIEIEILEIESQRVVVISIPSRSIGKVMKFHGVPLMRVGENLVEMDDETFKSIMMEGHTDFSAETMHELTLKDLDKNAVEILKKLWIQKSGNKDSENYSNEKLLKKLLLIKDGKITVAGLLLVGKENVIGQYLPQAELILEWRTEPNKIDYDLKKIWRKPFVTVVDDIWEVVNARNSRTPFKQGFIENDIWSYDRNSIREGVLNAFAHREYRNRTEPVFIKLSPNEFAIKSPGGFLPGVDSNNALYVEGKWRNRFLMEVLHEIGLVERSGVGLDRVFMTSIRNGKGMPMLEETSDDFVKLTLPALVQDIAFVSYLEKVSAKKQIIFNEIEDLIEIEHIRKTGKYIDKVKVERYLKSQIVEKVGIGTGTKYILARDYYEHVGKKGEYTRKKGLNKEARLSLLRNYFKDNHFGNMDDFRDVFDQNLDRKQIQRLLNVLREEELIYFDPNPSPQKGYWKLRRQVGGNLGAT